MLEVVCYTRINKRNKGAEEPKSKKDEKGNLAKQKQTVLNSSDQTIRKKKEWEHNPRSK